MTARGAPYFFRASSTSASMKSTMPLTSACDRRSSTVPRRHASATTSALPVFFTDSANAIEPLRGVRAAVQEDVLDEDEQVLRDLLVDRELARVHDAHVEAGARSRGRGTPRASPRGPRCSRGTRRRCSRRRPTPSRAGSVALIAPRRLEEVHRVRVVLLDAGRDREDVRVEDDVLGRKADLLREDAVGARGDRDLALDGRRLALLVERHDDDGGAVAAHEAGVRPEGLLALLQADRVHDGLALEALQPGLDHVPLRAVEHDRAASRCRARPRGGSGTASSRPSRPASPRPCSRRGRSRRRRPAGAPPRAPPRSRPRGRASRTSANP